MKDKDYYCNCEPDCIHKAKRLRKRKIWTTDGIVKAKVQICLNPHKDCTCKYQVSFGNVFNY